LKIYSNNKIPRSTASEIILNFKNICLNLVGSVYNEFEKTFLDYDSKFLNSEYLFFKFLESQEILILAEDDVLSKEFYDETGAIRQSFQLSFK
jgi:hypothetical protein